MCQYSGVAGSPSNWHYQHLGKLALSGAGVMIESAVKKGKITHKDLALYNTKKKILKKLKNLLINFKYTHWYSSFSFR